MFAKQALTYLFKTASKHGINVDKKGTAPASTTAYANSGVCLQISLNALAEILLNGISGS